MEFMVSLQKQEFLKNLRNSMVFVVVLEAQHLRERIHMVKLKENVRNLLDDSAERLALSARAYHRVIKIARTIADLDNSEEINSNHILEAIQYRPKVA